MVKVGDRFSMTDGEIVVLSVSGWRDVVVRFVDSGYEAKVITTHIKNGNVRDRFKRTIFGVGFIGGSKYKSSIKGKMTPEYTCWKNMIGRCYNEAKRDEYPTYAGVTVCDDWHNFQVFAEWYKKNYPKNEAADGYRYELDKDSLSGQSKIYSPETCLFMTNTDNTKLSSCKEYSIKSPDGDVFNVLGMRSFAMERGLDPSSMTKVAKGLKPSYRGWTPVE